MGLRNCCLSHKETNLYEGYNHLKNSEIIKPVFHINSISSKIQTFNFSESFKVKRYKLKNKKRLIIINEDNTISIFSFYLGNLIFLLSQFKVNEKYKIIKCCFMSEINSSRFCLVLEDLKKNLEILIIKIRKFKNKPNVELNVNTHKEEEDIEKEDEKIKTEFESSQKMELKNSNQNINDRNKKAVESIINSSFSSSDLDNSIDDEKLNENLDDKSNQNDESVIVLKHYDSEVTISYFNLLSKKQSKNIFLDLIMVKYNFYELEIKLIINDDIKNCSRIKIEYDLIYILDDLNILKCYKIGKSSKTYIILFKLNLDNLSNINLILPIYKENLFIIDGLDFLFYSENLLKFKRNFKDFFVNNFDNSDQYLKNVDFIKFTKIIKILPKSKMKKDFNTGIIFFYITGLCNLNRKINDLPMQFISTIVIDFYNNIKVDDVDITPIENYIKDEMILNNDLKFNDPHIKSKIRILNNVPFITEMSYGPFDNGPLITGHNKGTISIWNIYDLTITRVIKIFDEDISVKRIINEPFGVTICQSDFNVASFHLLNKKIEYFYNENENHELDRVIRYNTNGNKLNKN